MHLSSLTGATAVSSPGQSSLGQWSVPWPKALQLKENPLASDGGDRFEKRSVDQSQARSPVSRVSLISLTATQPHPGPSFGILSHPEMMAVAQSYESVLNQAESLEAYLPINFQIADEMYPTRLKDIVAHWLSSGPVSPESAKSLVENNAVGIFEESADMLYAAMKYMPLSQGLIADNQLEHIFDYIEGYIDNRYPGPKTMGGLKEGVMDVLDEEAHIGHYKRSIGAQTEREARWILFFNVLLMYLNKTHFNPQEPTQEVFRKEIQGETDELMEELPYKGIHRSLLKMGLAITTRLTVSRNSLISALGFRLMRQLIQTAVFRSIPRENRPRWNQTLGFLAFKYGTRTLMNLNHMKYSDVKKGNKPYEMLVQMAMLNQPNRQNYPKNLMFHALSYGTLPSSVPTNLK